jgi:DNA-binding NtrC family response regulator
MNSTRAHILVVDDSPSTVEILQRTLKNAGYDVATAPAVCEAIEILKVHSFDLVLTDLRMPRVGGLELVKYVRENLPHTGVIMITGFPSIDGAVAAVKGGADDFLAKPFTDEELLGAVQGALEAVSVRRSLEAEVDGGSSPTFGLIGESRAMRATFCSITKAAESNATVLLTGESGTGKELLARAIHYNGPRAGAPFVAVNCAGIPEALVESELFGHVRGAFTGAVTTRAGFFITADQGTIFLDEIGELTLSTQAKLLRILEDHQVRMVGANQERAVDVRVIAATNKDLRELVRKGQFREDLFFRLNILAIDVPPLRDREDDILQLLGHFSTKFASEAGKPVLRWTDRAIAAFRRHNWPGNVRELQNLIRRLVVMVDGDVIDVSDLPSLMRTSISGDRSLHRPLAEVEAEHLRAVLGSVGGNKTRAAKILGIDRKTLREKCRFPRLLT